VIDSFVVLFKHKIVE